MIGGMEVKVDSPFVSAGGELGEDYGFIPLGVQCGSHLLRSI